jgi:CBS domain-containing protein
MILVRHAMTASPQTISPDMNACDAAGLMKSEDVGSLPIVEDDRVVGVITDRDLVSRVLAERKDPMGVRVGDIATTAAVTVSPDMRLSEARDLMAQHRIRRLPVVKGDSLVGMLSMGDVAWSDSSIREVGEALKAVSESERTRRIADGPARGTPSRVMRRRPTSPGGALS